MRTKATIRVACGIFLGMGMLLPSASSAQSVDYEKGTRGTRILETRDGFPLLKMLVESSNLGGGEVELGEITFRPNGDRPIGNGHLHSSIEIFYVLEGQLDHIVNGESHLLDPGMVGIVRPGDRVVHRVPGSDPVVALVIWAPGGTAEGIAANMVSKPIPEGS